MCYEAKEKYRGMFEIQKSGDKTSSGEIGLDIRTHASPKVGQDQVSEHIRSIYLSLKNTFLLKLPLQSQLHKLLQTVKLLYIFLILHFVNEHPSVLLFCFTLYLTVS